MKFSARHKTILGITATVSLLLLSTSNLMANSCSKADIDYYLQRGFTHDQVIRLCAGSPSANNTQGSPLPQHHASATPTMNYAQSNELIADRVYFETVLDAKATKLTPSELSYTAKECLKYGEENLGGLRDKACVNSQISINFKGLKVIKAVKGIMLIRDQEMILQGNIHREYLNYTALPHKQQSIIRARLPTNPQTLNLPVRKGIDPKQVASKLQKYITQ